MWSWGANSCGQLGLGLKNEQFETPQKVPWNHGQIVQVSGGGSHTLLLTQDNKVYVTGSNSKGQLGEVKDKDCDRFQCIDILATQVACGWDFSLLISPDHRLYGSGSNAFGQLGLGQELKQTDVFLEVPVGAIVTQVSAGMRHSAILCQDRSVLLTGCGKKGQLGRGKSVIKSFTHQKINLPGGLEAQSVACGQNFTLVMCTDNSTLVGFGDNKCKQLRDDSEKIFEPKIVITFDSPLKAISCGWTHVVCLSRTGKVSTWGRNTYSQLGRSTSDTDPCLNIDIEQISSGYEHVLAVSKSKELYVWGWNEHGNCGLNGVENVVTPTKLDLKMPVESCFAGSGHSFCITTGS